MARTLKAQRSYIDRVIEIRKLILPQLTKELQDLGNKLGAGIWRSTTSPGHRVEVSRNIGHTRVNYDRVLETLARTYGIPANELARVKRNCSERTKPSINLRVYVRTERVPVHKQIKEAA